jgi:hypothetical protein
MGPQSLSNILWAFAKLGVLPERSWLNAFFATSLQVRYVTMGALPTRLAAV